MEIVNGDAEISKTKTPFISKSHQHGFEDMLRNKILSDATREKQHLEQKLQYLSNSINNLQKYEEYRNLRSPISQRHSFSLEKKREKEEWRKEIEERALKIDKKRKIA